MTDEIAAQVSDAAFGHPGAPVCRVAGAFSSIPHADVLRAARDVLAY